MKLVTNVPAIETGAYFLIWIGVVLFSGFKVKKIGDGKLHVYEVHFV